MARKMMSNSNLKPVCSVIDLIRMLELSRARFYQLLKQGIFPPPVFDLRTRRPFYSLELQQTCLEVRESNIGFNGSYVLFYSPRKEKEKNKSDSKNKTNNSAHQEITETLKRMGLDVNGKQVSSAIENLFTEGIDKADSGIVIRELFRYFKKGASN